MKGIERRINRLDKNVAQLPCNEPGHDTMFMFWIGEEPRAEDLALIESIRQCKNCANQERLHVQFMKFGNVPEEIIPVSHKPAPIDVTPPRPRHEPAPVNFTFNIGDEGSKPEPQEQPARVRIAPWLKSLEG